jgi:hypothetical protein
VSRELLLLNILTEHKEELGLKSAYVSFDDKMILADGRDFTVKIIIQEDKDGTDGKTNNNTEG